MQDDHDYTALVKALKSGDAIAFKHIYNIYKRPLYAVALRYLKDQQLAEDALQDVYVKLWQNRSTIDERQSIKGFLLVCMKNHVLNVIRTEQNRIKAAFQAHHTEERYSNRTSADIAYSDLTGHLTKGLGLLPDSKRRIVQLSLLEGYSNQEIASKLQISEHTVRSQLSQAKKIIRRFMERTLIAIVLLSI